MTLLPLVVLSHPPNARDGPFTPLLRSARTTGACLDSNQSWIVLRVMQTAVKAVMLSIRALRAPDTMLHRWEGIYYR